MAASSSNGPSPSESDDPVATAEASTVAAEESLLSAQASGSGREGAGVTAHDRDRGVLASREDSTEKIAKGIASVLGPVVKLFETRVDEVVQSQSTLEGSIDRLTRELDKLLEDTPLPLAAQHAAKLSGIRKRVGSLTETLRVIQGRISSMDHVLSEQNKMGSLR